VTASYLTPALYDWLFDRCATGNQLAQAQIALENRMTPREAMTIAGHVTSTYGEGPVRRRITWLRIERDRRRQRELAVGTPRTAPRYLRALHAVQWAEGTRHQLELSGRPPARVERRWLRGGATMYASEVEGPRTLVIGFAGNLRGFMMPTQVFLQFLGSRPADVLKLEVPRGIGYVTGVRPHSHDFPSTLEWLASLIADGRYDRVVTVGTSGGGLPALLAAARLRVDAAFAAGPAAQMNATEMAAQLGAGSVLDVLAAASDETAVTIAYGEQSLRDTESVMYLAAALPAARLVRVADAGHACLFDLVERRAFTPLVDTAIFGDDAPAPPTDPVP
jgi:pimeloyl-ACP methyl ester carboxylesterase